LIVPSRGAGLAWVPAVTQGVGVTATVNLASYFRIGRMVFAWADLTLTSAGSATPQVIQCSVPVPGVFGSAARNGCGTAVFIHDPSVTSTGVVMAPVLVAASTLRFLHTDPTAATAQVTTLGSISNARWQIASGDRLTMSLMYEAAADA
jgi:hypothetical protein